MSSLTSALITDDVARAAIALVYKATGIDFSCYRQPMLRRRIDNHMLSAGISLPQLYLERLRDVHFARAAVERFTIKVSRFYRDPAMFDRLRHQFRTEGGSTRHVWSAGAGGGEEPYTYAMLLDEAALPGTVTATDIDETALHRSALGIYSGDSLKHLPGGWKERYFEQVAPYQWQVRRAIRDRVRFTSHDLMNTTPPPPGPYDIVSCRNVLIYFERAAQQTALYHLISALAPDGRLVLGEAEWPLPFAMSHLLADDSALRIFRHAASVMVA